MASVAWLNSRQESLWRAGRTLKSDDEANRNKAENFLSPFDSKVDRE